jgi:homoserine dehydrogenase
LRRITLIQVGFGTVGGAVIDQVLEQQERWKKQLGLEVVVGAVGGQEGAVVDGAGIPAETLRRFVEGRRRGERLSALARAPLVPLSEALNVASEPSVTIVLDAAAGDATAALDAAALRAGGGVVLSNKAPLAIPSESGLTEILWSAAAHQTHLRYEATCGAGLPIISSLRSLLATGDEVLEIQGALSGTLGAIFADLAVRTPFSKAVRDAKARGYTEPDPRDDLSGLDVARKALILARTIGRRIDLSEMTIESLVPDHLQGVSVDEFLDRVVEVDDSFAKRAEAAWAVGATLKYVATVTPGGQLAVGVREIPATGVLGALQGPENVVSIRTRRYDAYPMTIVGPGAGAEVTAAGMIADVLALAAGSLGRSVSR